MGELSWGEFYVARVVLGRVVFGASCPDSCATLLCSTTLEVSVNIGGRSSLTNEKDHHYFLNRFVCVGEFFDG